MNNQQSTRELETLAALLDGRLRGEERAAAIRLIARDEKALALFVESAEAIRDEEEEEDPKREEAPRVGVLPWPAKKSAGKTPRAKPRSPLARLLPYAAATLALVGGTLFWNSRPPATTTLLAQFREPLRPQDLTRYAVDNFRGDDDFEEAPASTAGVQLGVLTLQLATRLNVVGADAVDVEDLILDLNSLAVTTGQSLGAETKITDDIQRMHDQLERGAIGPRELRAKLPGWEAQIRRQLGRRQLGWDFQFGRWAQAALLAAEKKDSAALHSRAMRRLYRGAMKNRGSYIEVKASLDSIDQSLRQQPDNFAQLEADLITMLNIYFGQEY